MAKFITIGYGDQAGYNQTPKDIRDAAHAADAERVRQGDVMGVAGKPVQVRNPNGSDIELREGPFLTAGLPIAGFAPIEAPNLGAAIAIAATSPCAVVRGVVEIWPLQSPLDAQS